MYFNLGDHKAESEASSESDARGQIQKLRWGTWRWGLTPCVVEIMSDDDVNNNDLDSVDQMILCKLAIRSYSTYLQREASFTVDPKFINRQEGNTFQIRQC